MSVQVEVGGVKYDNACVCGDVLLAQLKNSCAVIYNSLYIYQLYMGSFIHVCVMCLSRWRLILKRCLSTS